MFLISIQKQRSQSILLLDWMICFLLSTIKNCLDLKDLIKDKKPIGRKITQIVFLNISLLGYIIDIFNIILKY